MTAYLIRTCPWADERYEWAKDLQRQLPGAELVEDATHSVLDTALRAVKLVERHGGWVLEDDVVLTSRFQAKARWTARMHPDSLISGFSWRLKGDDGRWVPGRRFFGALCLYFPPQLAQGFLGWVQTPVIYQYYRHFNERDGVKGGTFDTALRDYLTQHEQRWWLECPNLVQHRTAPSLIRPGRSRKRLSATFEP